MSDAFEKPMIYLGSAQHFRAMMQRLTIRHRSAWVSAQGDRLVFSEERQTKREVIAVIDERSPFGGSAPRHHSKQVDVTPPTRGTWGVWIRFPDGNLDMGRRASIEAFEQPNKQTLIEFLDARDPGHVVPCKPIGPAFEQFADWIARETGLRQHIGESDSDQAAARMRTDGIDGENLTADDAWYKGTLLAYTPSSGSIIELSDRRLVQAREIQPWSVSDTLDEQKSQVVEELNYRPEDQPWYTPGLPETKEIGLPHTEALKRDIDVVIITATDIELKAVMALFRPYPRRKYILRVYSGPETYYLGKFGEHMAVVTKCRMGAISEGSVILATEQALRLWTPRAVIMVGIAFGKDPKTQRIGDVFVASQIISYEQQRVEQEGIVHRGSITPSNTTLLNRFENVLNWEFTRPDGSRCNVIIGPVLSGEKLVDDPVFKASLFQHFPQAVGGEMEGAGLCAATGRIGTAWILVKAICDWGDGKKHEQHQPLAAAAAASLVHHVLSQKNVLNAIKKS